MALLERVTQDVISSEKAYTPEFIIEKTAACFSVSPDDVLGKGKTKNVTAARQVATYLMRKLTGLTLDEIGKILSRDHSTILYSIKKVEESINTDPALNDTIRDITANIMNK